jgi:hypothetical protein
MSTCYCTLMAFRIKQCFLSDGHDEMTISYVGNEIMD